MPKVKSKKSSKKVRRVSSRSSVKRRKKNPCGPCMAAMNPHSHRKRNPHRKSMTYGVLPTYEEYSKAFKAEVPDGWFRIRKPKLGAASRAKNNNRQGDVDLNEIALWLELNAAVNEDTEESLNWASMIMESLGFEWI